MSLTRQIRLFTVTDLHRSVHRYEALVQAIQHHEPDIVAFVGDFLGSDKHGLDLLAVSETASIISDLPAKHLLFTRGNHEDSQWQDFVFAWPMEKRPLIALHGTSIAFGPLVIVGFPCSLGWDLPWCETLPKQGNELTYDHTLSGRRQLPATDVWLPKLMRELGPPGRTVWLMHEPPLSHPLAASIAQNRDWYLALQRFFPLLTISGHDHSTPIRNNIWHVHTGQTTCVNVGQGTSQLHYCVIDFQFQRSEPSLPVSITLHAFPQNQIHQITLRSDT